VPLELSKLLSRVRPGVSAVASVAIGAIAALPGAPHTSEGHRGIARESPAASTSIKPTLEFTSPRASVAAAPQTASLAVPGVAGTFYVPYIQTSPTLDIALDHNGPENRSIVDVTLDAGSAAAREVRLLDAPWRARFEDVGFGEHTLTATLYAPEDGIPLQVAMEGPPLATAYLDHVARGDIVAALGDSTTEGLGTGPWQPGELDLLGAFPDWTAAGRALAGTHPEWMTPDGRNFPQPGATLHPASRPSFTVGLARTLEAQRGHPVLVLNEGWSGTTSDGYMRISTSGYFAGLTASAHPNAWLINLGANDPLMQRTAAEYQARLQALVGNLENLYGAPASSIHVACPSYATQAERQATEASYLPGIDHLRSADHLGPAPDLFGYFRDHPEDIADAVHPNLAGYAAMAQLWAGALAGQNQACS
jgi:lysophospholipase L1-like esterase